jgi:hypothetical protein
MYLFYFEYFLCISKRNGREITILFLSSLEQLQSDTLGLTFVILSDSIMIMVYLLDIICKVKKWFNEK